MTLFLGERVVGLSEAVEGDRHRHVVSAGIGE